MSVTHGLQFMERVIHGVTDYAKQNTHWTFTRAPETFGTSLEWLKFWHGDGRFLCRAHARRCQVGARLWHPDRESGHASFRLRGPVDHGRSLRHRRMAARHLLEHNFQRFGYYGPSDLLFAQLRRDGFCSVISQAGGDVKLLEFHTVEDSSKQKLDEQQQALEQWLRDLQAPVGILASADLRASMVLEACQKTAFARARRCGCRRGG